MGGGGGTSHLCGVIPLGAEDGEITGDGCLEVAYHDGRLREHFMYRKVFSRIEVVQESKDPLPCCDLCRMHMPEGRLIKHQRTNRRDRNTQMQWWRRDVLITS